MVQNCLPPDATADVNAPVMVFSPERRDALCARLAPLAVRISGARRAKGLARRISALGATVVLVDAAHMAGEAMHIIADLAQAAGNGGVAIVATYPAGGDDALRLVEAGATHVLPDPCSDAELLAAITAGRRFAGRGAQSGAHSGPERRDKLTGLADSVELRRWIERENRTHPVWLSLVKISRFDAVNSAFGLEAADALLRAAGNRIEPLVAEAGFNALVARLPGAEFGIALSGEITPERALILAEAVVERLGLPISIDAEAVRLGCHVGIASAEAGAEGAEALLRRTSKAVAEARSGVSTIRLVTQGDAEISDLNATLQADLRAALGRNEIEILFQPQVSISSGRIEGVEALARWRHPRHGQIGAKTLFLVAQQSDYLLELSAHIQRQALDIASAWPATLRRLRLSLNVTGQDVRQPRFAKRFLRRVEVSGFPKNRLTIEITESGLMDDLPASARALAQLRAAGCRVAIDDFGTGYSSLAYLKDLPADYLKLDQGLSAEIAGSARDRVVVRGAIEMARSLGLSVIAEGVESEAQLRLLAREGCSHYQGFLRAGALDIAALEDMVASDA